MKNRAHWATHEELTLLLNVAKSFYCHIDADKSPAPASRAIHYSILACGVDIFFSN